MPGVSNKRKACIELAEYLLKKRREHEEMLTDRVNCSSAFANMPADIFLKVCDYLDFADICRAGRVCVRWYRLTRGEYVWGHTDITSLNLTQDKAQKLLTSLPPSVRHLWIGSSSPGAARCGTARHQMTLPALFYQINERCSLSSLIIENGLLVRSDMPYVWRSGYMLNCKTPPKEQVNAWYLEIKYTAEDRNGDFLPLYYHFPTLTVLSLRSSVFAVEDIFPGENAVMLESKIEVLDLTRCPSTLDKNMLSICRLPHLQELYLSGSAVTINGVLSILKNLRHLKVLDLDNTAVGGETFSVLKRLGGRLLQIYLGGTAIKDEHLVDVDASCFPSLREICLRRTRVTHVGIEILVKSVPSLKQILVPRDTVNLGWLVDQDYRAREKLIASEDEEDEECSHFLENRFRGNFKKGPML